MASSTILHDFQRSLISAECKKLLDAGNSAEHDGEVFCSSCHRKSFGPKGYGYGVGAGSLSMDSGKAVKEVKVFMEIIFYMYFNVYSKVHKDHQASAYVAPRNASSEPVERSAKPKVKIGGADICPRCGGKVRIVQFVTTFSILTPILL